MSPGHERLIHFIRSNPPASPTPADMRVWFENLTRATPIAEGARLVPIEASFQAFFVDPPGSRADHVILYLHGGGYVLGSSETHLDLIFRLAKSASTRALSVDYRLAPEHPLSAGLEDAVAAYDWLLAQGFSPKNIAIVGDSAGGGLSLRTLLALHDAGKPQPGCALLLSPWVDFTGSGESMKTNAETDPLVSPEGLNMMAQIALRGGDPKQESPLFADLSGLAPMLVQAGDAEVLLDDARRLVAYAREAGTDATLDLWKGMPHVFQIFPTFLEEAIPGTDRGAAFVRERLGR